MVRDVIVSRPLGAISSPLYAYLILGTVGIGYLFLRVIDRLRSKDPPHGRDAKPTDEGSFLGQAGNIVEIFDALGLAAFTVTGVVVALSQQVHPLWLWGPLLATLTGAGGGIGASVARAIAAAGAECVLVGRRERTLAAE